MAKIKRTKTAEFIPYVNLALKDDYLHLLLSRERTDNSRKKNITEI